MSWTCLLVKEQVLVILILFDPLSVWTRLGSQLLQTVEVTQAKKCMTSNERYIRTRIFKRETVSRRKRIEF